MQRPSSAHICPGVYSVMIIWTSWVVYLSTISLHSSATGLLMSKYYISIFVRYGAKLNTHLSIIFDIIMYLKRWQTCSRVFWIYSSVLLSATSLSISPTTYSHIMQYGRSSSSSSSLESSVINTSDICCSILWTFDVNKPSSVHIYIEYIKILWLIHIVKRNHLRKYIFIIQHYFWVRCVIFH